jgi:hypothetical protein
MSHTLLGCCCSNKQVEEGGEGKWRYCSTKQVEESGEGRWCYCSDNKLKKVMKEMVQLC